MTKKQLLINDFRPDTPESLLFQAIQKSEKVVFSTSFGKEDQAIIFLIQKEQLPISIFTLDTGRLFEETHEVHSRTINKYQVQIKGYSPDQNKLSELVSKKGPLSFYESIENRKECCAIRKIEPLTRALENAEIWITGLRKEQSLNRAQMSQIEWDESNQVIKIHPLFYWSNEQLNLFLDTNKIPINVLHKKGFPSIGCAPCTRAIEKGEDERAGRWWWEGSKKECGLHQTN
jgi:phosphoadenosine phosphosulfate reductase